MDKNKKIDYVIPFVDPTIKRWRETVNYYLKRSHLDKDEFSKRFNNNGLFKYVFRSLEKNMPWIGKLILVVQSEEHIPKWVDKSSVTIVTHKDFIPA